MDPGGDMRPICAHDVIFLSEKVVRTASLLARLTVATSADEQKSTTKEESSSNDAVDWRIRLVSHLAKDVPGTAAGAPAHKAGALILGSTLGRDAKGRIVGFATPSAIALALDLAI